METEQDPNLVAISSQSRQVQQFVAEEGEESGEKPQKGLNIAPLLRTFQRQALIIIAILGMAGGATVYQIKGSKKTYQGDFRILVEPVTTEARIADPSSLTNREGGVPSRDFFSLDYATQLEILQSPQMLLAITKQVQKRDPKFTEEILKKGLVVFRLGENELTKTKILEVRFLGQDPKLVEFVLQETKKKYLKYSLDERKSRIGEGVKFIEDQLPRLNKRVNDLKSELQVIQQQQRIADPKEQGTQLIVQARAIETLESDTKRLLQEQKTLYANLQKQLDFTPNEAIAASALSEEPQYKELLTKVKEVEGQIAVETARFKSANPIVEALERKRANLIGLLNKQTDRILGQNLVGAEANSKVKNFQNSIRIGLIKQLVDTANQVQVLEARNEAIIKTKDNLNRQAREFPMVARRYNEFQQELDIAARTRDQLLTQRETLGVQAAQSQIPWEIISEPQIPKGSDGKEIPVASKNTNKLMMGVIGGLVAGLGLSIIIEKLRDKFFCADDVKDAVDPPLLGAIPINKKAQKFYPSIANAYEVLESNENKYKKNASQFIEAFDSLYTNIRFLSSHRPIASLVIGSATPGEGKSTIALNLAYVAALAGQRVLLVDANLHSPSLDLLLELPNSKGLSDLLENKIEFKEAIQRSPIANNLFVLTAGIPLAGTSRRLASSQMQYLMAEFNAIFDLVIYDTPPLVDNKDANFLAARTDGILMVVSILKVKHSVVKKVFAQLENFGIPCLGTVANHLGKNKKYQPSKAPVVEDKNEYLNFSPVPSTMPKLAPKKE
ncbi:MAG: polysaccharide biosynthesis tyrosine autokinase [Tychonema bourrellyi B0820]|uniref:non-specific protein-tyrosine kinase n=1 Tax=Tychonema bourrellyi FEM_GT703 TaxID=2040638 RepID=A0A2G4EXN7_9CYAN|nr:tyrosine-protein kinase domain-containing protein [Tychonema bourrellyi]MDQ2100582.1 polysaccharide biosynthesis tyrosine autokinase [Tychonema bourrellyi B0820]PHX54238.1 capsular biosynthesis protein [Tychonema bourrellyi FEM_GT703]